MLGTIPETARVILGEYLAKNEVSLSGAEQFRQRLEILYGEALDAKKANASQVRGRANALIESYNDLRREIKGSIAPDLDIPELKQVSTCIEDFNDITVAQTRIGQIISHVTNTMIALGFQVPSVACETCCQRICRHAAREDLGIVR